MFVRSSQTAPLKGNNLILILNFSFAKAEGGAD